MVATPTLRTGEIRQAHSTPTIVPVKLHVERALGRAPERVFQAYADDAERTRWQLHPDVVVDVESIDFREGGGDRFRCRGVDRQTFVVSIDYRHIVDNKCMVFVEELSNTAGQLLSVSLVSWTMAQSGANTILAISDQTTSIVGSSPIESGRYNYERMLDRLADHLADAA